MKAIERRQAELTKELDGRTRFPDVKTFGLSILGGTAGYAVGLFGGMVLVSMLSSNTHDKSMEVVITGFFVTGPLMAVIGFVGTLIYRLARSKR